jgi:hypothetical protein
VNDVKRLARWTGWCDPCEIERPLVLTEAGERGVRAWLRGIGPEDRTLTLTCVVCGSWQDVPHYEDEPVDTAEPVVVELAETVEIAETVVAEVAETVVIEATETVETTEAAAPEVPTPAVVAARPLGFRHAIVTPAAEDSPYPAASIPVPRLQPADSLDNNLGLLVEGFDLIASGGPSRASR